MKLLTKFESKSNRVKGIAFHPKRPWVLSSLHNGTIQLWDYRMGTLIDKFEEHDGPVRGIAFHPTQNLFVSGGDDRKIKVWNIKTRRCLFTLTGHMDYIRTVVFHHELPWIMSASDDQTIRIWNWQSRNCISTLTGHNHYVMCAKFHPTENLIASACLDLTVRIWDYSGLRKKNYTPQNAATRTPEEEALRVISHTTDVFGNLDVSVKFVLEGHTKGVNWVDFHPTLPLVASGGDDRQVKLWRMNESRAWEVDTCRGHYNNVSCVAFHPHKELLVSNSEDRSIRVWDMTKRSLIQSFRREGDRYWVLAAHPNLNLFAAGHDSGMLVFKLERERPAMAVHQDTMLYVKDKEVRIHSFSSGKDQSVFTFRRGTQYASPPRGLTFNPIDKTVILTSESDSGSHFEVFNANKFSDDVAAGQKANGTGAIFISRNRFVSFDREKNQLDVRDLECNSLKVIKLTNLVNDIFTAPGGNLLLTSNKQVTLFDTTQKKDLATINASEIRYAYWSADNSMVALIGKHTITIADKDLNQKCQIHETIRVKSGTWDSIGVFIYTTLNHIKYLIPQGDNGIICTLDQPIYLTRAKGQQIHYLDRDANPQIATIDNAEYKFKLALIKQDYDQVIHAIKHSNLVGQSIIAYLRKKGYSEIALHFIKDERTRFELALECGNLQAALTSAKVLDSEASWIKLAKEALLQGNVQIVTLCYQKVYQFDKLSFLYFITGDHDKVAKMQTIAEKRGDLKAQFHNSIYLGDAFKRVEVLRQANQNVLAYLTAKNSGLDELAQTIADEAGIAPEILAKLPVQSTKPTVCKPVLGVADGNWPTLNVSKGVFDRFFAALESSQAGGLGDDGELDDDVADGWGQDVDADVDEDAEGSPTQDRYVDADEGEEASGWGLDDDVAIDDAIDAELVNNVQSTEFAMPQKDGDDLEKWARSSPFAVDHVAAGSFEQAMQLLNRQLGIINFQPLKEHFLLANAASKAYVVANEGLPSLQINLRRNPDAKPADLRPVKVFGLDMAIAELKEGYKLFKANKIAEALTKFQCTLQLIPLVVVENSDEVDELKQLVHICKEYTLALQLETERRKLAAQPNPDSDTTKRILELAAYFTHCQLDPQHLTLALVLAMNTAFKAKNLKTAATFAAKLLELGPGEKLATQAKKIQTVTNRNPTDAIELEYDPYNPFTLDANSFVPIYQGSESAACPYCQATYNKDVDVEEVCKVCNLAKIGANATGLRCL